MIDTFLWILSLFTAFSIMEFMAWFSHKYIMHGFLWFLHKDHHKKNHKSWFERNDVFFIFYAVVSMLFVISWSEYGFFFPCSNFVYYHYLRQNYHQQLRYPFSNLWSNQISNNYIAFSIDMPALTSIVVKIKKIVYRVSIK